MNSNYLWRSKWEKQWWALAGKKEFSHAAGEPPWGNLCDKWLDIHAHVSTLQVGTSCILPVFFNFYSNFYFYLLQKFLLAFTRFYSRLHHLLSLLSLYPEAKCVAALPGWPAFSITSGSVCSCTLFHVCPVKTGRLVIQSDWRGVMLQIRPLLKEPLLHVAPCVCLDWVCPYHHRTFSFPSIIILPPISLPPPYLFKPAQLWELQSYFLHLPVCFSSCYLEQMLCQISPLFNIRGLSYACFSLPVQWVLHSRIQDGEIVEPAAKRGPTLCRLCLNDRSVCLSYASQDRWIHLPSQWSGSDRKCIRKQF